MSLRDWIIGALLIVVVSLVKTVPEQQACLTQVVDGGGNVHQFAGRIVPVSVD